MSRMDLSTEELFLRLGSTPATRSARADKLFRRLRESDAELIKNALKAAPKRVTMSPQKAPKAVTKKP